jgi:PTH1 family peptidyl-tRNA hydrolase
MRLVIGLGNPGEKYRDNRHNVGYLVVDKLNLLTHGGDTVVKKSDVFMNNSGESVKKIVDRYHLELSNLWVIHDDLDIPIGSYKIQFGKGPKVHNGLNDVYQKLGTNEFWHVRVGVDNRNPEDRAKGEEYVLQDFTNEEQEILDGAINEACKKLVTL